MSEIYLLSISISSLKTLFWSLSFLLTSFSLSNSDDIRANLFSYYVMSLFNWSNSLVFLLKSWFYFSKMETLESWYWSCLFCYLRWLISFVWLWINLFNLSISSPAFLSFSFKRLMSFLSLNSCSLSLSTWVILTLSPLFSEETFLNSSFKRFLSFSTCLNSFSMYVLFLETSSYLFYLSWVIKWSL